MTRNPSNGAFQGEALIQRDVHAALRTIDRATAARLLAFANRLSREPLALVDEAITRVLDGRRRWRSDDPPQLYNFLCGVMRSIASAERKHDARSPFVSGETQAASAPSVTAETLSERKEIAFAIHSCAATDAQLRAFHDSVLDGATSREEIANDLGIDPEAVSVIRKRFQRQLVDQAPALFADKLQTRGKR